MNKTTALIALNRASKTVSFALLFKSAVGVSLFCLRLFGATVPHFGIEPTFTTGAGAAGFGRSWAHSSPSRRELAIAAERRTASIDG